MKITDIGVTRLGGTFTPSDLPTGDRQSTQLDIYPEFNIDHTRPSATHQIHALYVEVATNEGLTGIWGPIDEFQVHPILASLKPLLVGRDPLATELLYDLMVRSDRHGRSGYFMTAVSAVDCALWDLRGKAAGQPIHRLLGGPTRPTVPSYASMLGFSVEAAEAKKTASEYQAMGYTAQKWFFRHGPGDGTTGMERNLAMAFAVREAVGKSYKLMFDAFMGWDVPYTREMLRLLEPVAPAWMEEPLPPERVGAFAALRKSTSIPLATGEHTYTRWQIMELLVRGAADYVQSDPDWCGGISELVKICALSSAFDVPVVAHGHSILPALHVAGAQSPTVVPNVEFLIRHQAYKQHFHLEFVSPVRGEVQLPHVPGLGFEIDERKVESRTRLTGVLG